MQKLPGQSAGLDAVRAARMGGFGFAFYGPYQHYWYKYLDKLFPTKSVPHFASKVWQFLRRSSSLHSLGKVHLPRMKECAGILEVLRMDPTCPWHAAASEV